MTFALVYSWLLGCVHTPPQPPFPGTAERTTVRRAVITRSGVECSWEAEQLTFEGRPLWTAEPPDDENWCHDGSETARMVDIRGQDGRFLGTVLTTFEDGRWSARCVTWDLTSGQPVTLSLYDPEHAEKRWESAVSALERDRSLEGWLLERDAFLVGGGHVRFCATLGRSTREIPVR